MPGAAARSGPDDSHERALANQGHRWQAGVDEVGTGSWAGPLFVTAVVLDLTALSVAPAGVTDSKQLTARARRALVPDLQAWVHQFAHGTATAAEIDALGMTAALRLAGQRAFAQLRPVDVILLDGPRNYLQVPQPVHCVVKGDARCVSIAAASVLAKVARDDHMASLGTRHPQYGFDRNAGYPSPAHRAALAQHGPLDEHRRSWRWIDDYPQWRHLRRGRGSDQLTLLP